MAAAIGASMRACGVHQGLAPVLDVARDPRWGRTEETIGEDPYLVGTIGTAYVLGLQAAGVDATLKHFAGYSASRGGRNMAPVSIGRREFADVILPPFEMAIRLGGARSVMPTYIDLDGVPATADGELIGGLLRTELGFDGLVVSDYYAVSFLEQQHSVAASPSEAAAVALRAGIDVELPAVRCYGTPLRKAIAAGLADEAVVDRAAARVLTRKCELGMLDPDWTALPSPEGTLQASPPDLDPPEHRKLAGRLAEESVILLANSGGVLPLRPGARIAVVGPLADDPLAFFGCYSMPRHLSEAYPEAAASVPVTTLLSALRVELAAVGPEPTGGPATVSYARGCDVRSQDSSGFAAAVAVAKAAEIVVAVVGDEAGMFGRGTSGEGCDVTSLRLRRRPGRSATGASGHRDPGDRGAGHRPAVRAQCRGRPAGRDRASLLSRRGGRQGDRRRAVRTDRAQRQAARRNAGPGRGPAVVLPQVQARRPARRKLGGSVAAVRVRARPVVHQLWLR